MKKICIKDLAFKFIFLVIFVMVLTIYCSKNRTAQKIDNKYNSALSVELQNILKTVLAIVNKKRSSFNDLFIIKFFYAQQDSACYFIVYNNYSYSTEELVGYFKLYGKFFLFLTDNCLISDLYYDKSLLQTDIERHFDSYKKIDKMIFEPTEFYFQLNKSGIKRIDRDEFINTITEDNKFFQN